MPIYRPFRGILGPFQRSFGVFARIRLKTVAQLRCRQLRERKGSKTAEKGPKWANEVKIRQKQPK
jgi:hypothetical protein